MAGRLQPPAFRGRQANPFETVFKIFLVLGIGIPDANKIVVEVIKEETEATRREKLLSLTKDIGVLKAPGSPDTRKLNVAEQLSLFNAIERNLLGLQKYEEGEVKAEKNGVLYQADAKRPQR